MASVEGTSCHRTVTNPDCNQERDEPPSSCAVRYAGFGSRLVANLVDFVVFVPLMVVDWMLSASRAGSMVSCALLQIIAIAYPVAMHARWGQTLGKMVARIRVVKLSGDPLSTREAALRSSVDIGLGLAVTASALFAMTRLPESAWTDDWLLVQTMLRGLEPSWGPWAAVALQVWAWGELIALLSNRRRRAIHDFIAGTVVVESSTEQQATAHSAPAN